MKIILFNQKTRNSPEAQFLIKEVNQLKKLLIIKSVLVHKPPSVNLLVGYGQFSYHLEGGMVIGKVAYQLQDGKMDYSLGSIDQINQMEVSHDH